MRVFGIVVYSMGNMRVRVFGIVMGLVHSMGNYNEIHDYFTGIHYA